MGKQRKYAIVLIILSACFLIVVNLSRIRRALFGDIVLTTCAWGFALEGWLDANQNGVRDDDESPMPGIVYVVRFDNSGSLQLTSDEQGRVEHAFHINCDPTLQHTAVHIAPQVPSRMVLTSSPAEYELSTDLGLEAPLQFGFAFLDDSGVTPVP